VERVTRFRPSVLPDIKAVMGSAIPAGTWRVLCAQICGWPAWTILVDGQPWALCGMAPSGTLRNVWLAVPSGLSRRPYFRAAMRELLIKVATIEPEASLLAHIHDRNSEGQRMARLAGFMPTDDMMPDGQTRAWVRPPFSDSGNVTGGEQP